jgi:hypothetical protein
MAAPIVVPAVPAAPAIAATAAPAIAATAAPAVGAGVLIQLLKTLGVETVAELLAGKIAGSFSPADYNPKNRNENTGKYFLGADTYVDREVFEANENYRRAALRKLFGLPLNPVETTADVYERLEDTRERQAESLAKREQAMRQLAGDIAFKQEELVGSQRFKQAKMEKEFELERAGLEKEFSLEEVKQKAISDIERQKYLSAYDAAKNLLNSTINAISGTSSYTNNPDLRQVATPV